MARTNPGTFYERSAVAVLAYITTPTGALPQPGWIATNGIVLRVYDETTQTLVHTETADPADTDLLPDSIAVLSAAANVGYNWPDSIGWNIGMVLNSALWNSSAGSVGGRSYRFEWELTYDTTGNGAPAYMAEKVQRFSQRGVCEPLLGG